MRAGVGIDFGTTNSVAATFDGERVHLVPLEGDEAIMPSATYIDTSLRTETGQAAIDRYIADNTGRTVELVPEVIGAATILVNDADPEHRHAPETLTQRIYGEPMRDCGMQGRLFRGTKRLLGDANVRRLMVFDHPFRLVALITPILLRIRRSIEACGVDGRHACVGHPVVFEGRDPHRNALALARLGEAYGHAGVRSHTFCPEPVAAALSWMSRAAAEGEGLVLTVDFGGGTLDFAVLKRAGRSFEVLATHGVALGGDHIDQRLFRELLFPLLGKGEIWRRRGFDKELIETRFPFEDFEELLLNWAVTYLLNQNRYTTPVLDCIAQGGPAAHKFRRLRDLIQHNLSYLVFQTIKEFKAALSVSEEAVLDIPEIDVELRLTRARFEEIIAGELERVEQGVEETLAAARLAGSDVDVVLRTGGSSLIPAVKRILEDRFPGRVVEHDPFTSVAAGLAIADFHGHRFG
jgi:hypothetical chaperone protein